MNWWHSSTCLQVLAAELPGLVSSLSFKKSMRWDGFGVAYSRPMRWLLALHGNTPIPFSYGGLQASTSTRVLRNAPQPQVQVQAAGGYLELLKHESIQLDFASRRKAIWEGATAAAAEVGCMQHQCSSGFIIPPILSTHPAMVAVNHCQIVVAHDNLFGTGA
jgi:glycyl-tRNA synthetase